MQRKSPKPQEIPSLPKSPTGIQGLDEITSGGLPTGRPTLISGSAGSGKTILAVEFLARGAMQFGESGVFMMFEENSEELAANVRSMGFDLKKLVSQKQLVMDHVRIERSEIEETGQYDLEGLFIRLGHAIDSIGAKRVVLDTIEALFAGLPNHAILRAELRRLFRWLKERGITAVITGEAGDHALTRFGLEEYVADCVIVLDHRVEEQISTRRMRILKYRGSVHGTNEYPFLIGERGVSVLPITSLKLEHHASSERVSSGVPKLDEMLGGAGFYKGSSVLVSGSSGTGKSTIAASFVDAACRRGEKCLVFAYEESVAQIVRNMRSVGIDLEPWLKKGLLRIQSSRPTLHGLEQHLVIMHDAVMHFKPAAVVVDPISNLTLDSEDVEVKPTLMRLVDFLKQQEITTLFTSLTSGVSGEESQMGVSSLMDTWLLLRNVEFNGERNRTLYVLKARGMAHSNQVREFVMGNEGIDLVDVYLGAGRVLTGAARVAQEAHEEAEAALRRQDHQRQLRQAAARQKARDAQIAALQAESVADSAELESSMAVESIATQRREESLQKLARLRSGSKSANSKPKAKR